MTELEFFILDWIQNHLQTELGDVLMPLISALGNGGIIWILLAVVLCCIPKYRRLGITLFLALILDALLCNALLKPMVARLRPFQVHPDVTLLISAPTDYSFPSGHTAAAFTSACTLLFGKKNRIWIPALLLAICIAFSRLYLYVHYPTDVLAGILLGLLLGLVSNFLYIHLSPFCKQKFQQWKANHAIQKQERGR